MTKLGKGWYDTISSETGFEKGVHNWKVKVLKIQKDVVGCICFGIISETEWERTGQNRDDFLWDNKAGNTYYYYGKDNKGCLRRNIPCWFLARRVLGYEMEMV